MTDSLLSSTLMYFGMTKNRARLEDRKNIGGLHVATLENVPQFIIQFSELYYFRNTITFTQAGFPLLTLALIFDTLAVVSARLVYNQLYWDGKPSKKNLEGKFVVREKRDRLLILILGLVTLFPPVFMISMIDIKTLKYDQINPDLFAEGMVPEFDSNYGQHFSFIALCVFIIFILHSWYKLKQAFNMSKEQPLPEPDDQWRKMYYHSYRAQVLLPSPIDWYVNKDPSKLRWTPMDD